MVYTKKCDNCGKLLDFGGSTGEDSLPPNAIEFDGSIYCKECVYELVKFSGISIGELVKLREEIDAIKEELGMPEDLA